MSVLRKQHHKTLYYIYGPSLSVSQTVESEFQTETDFCNCNVFLCAHYHGPNNTFYIGYRETYDGCLINSCSTLQQGIRVSKEQAWSHWN